MDGISPITPPLITFVTETSTLPDKNGEQRAFNLNMTANLKNGETAELFSELAQDAYLLNTELGDRGTGMLAGNRAEQRLPANVRTPVDAGAAQYASEQSGTLNDAYIVSLSNAKGTMSTSLNDMAYWLGGSYNSQGKTNRNSAVSRNLGVSKGLFTVIRSAAANEQAGVKISNRIQGLFFLEGGDELGRVLTGVFAGKADPLSGAGTVISDADQTTEASAQNRRPLTGTASQQAESDAPQSGGVTIKKGVTGIAAAAGNATQIDEALDNIQKPFAQKQPFVQINSLSSYSVGSRVLFGGKNIAEQMVDISMLPRFAGISGQQDLPEIADKYGQERTAFTGSLANLAKITELPYSLYIFGNTTSNEKSEAEQLVQRQKPNAAEAFEGQQGEYLRISEAIRMASIIHNLYYGGSGIFEQGAPWHTVYIRYAIRNGLVNEGDFENYQDFATRAEAAYIFSHAVPPAELPVLNHISELQDVSQDRRFYSNILTLFQAGVMTGTDAVGTVHPGRLITREEAAVIAGRIATPSDRKILPPKKP